MLLEDDGGYWIAPTIKSDEDVDLLIKNPMSAIVADGMALAPDGPLGNPGKPNSYGTFPRALRLYVRDKRILTWEEAITKMTSIPAQRVGLWDRGIVRPNMKADLVVFNPDSVIENATYGSPNEYPEGIYWVIVNGQISVSPHGHTGARSGKVL
jgi:N-acyl-D-aspartate/D-glutamate deacylase